MMIDKEVEILKLDLEKSKDEEVKVIIISFQTLEFYKKLTGNELPVDDKQVILISVNEPIDALKKFKEIIGMKKVAANLLCILNAHSQVIKKSNELEMGFGGDELVLVREFFQFLTQIFTLSYPGNKLHMDFWGCQSGHIAYIKLFEKNLVQLLPVGSCLFTHSSPNSVIIAESFDDFIQRKLSILKASKFNFQNPAEFFLKNLSIFFSNSFGFAMNLGLGKYDPIFYVKALPKYINAKNLRVWIKEVHDDFVQFCEVNDIALSEESKCFKELTDEQLNEIRYSIFLAAIGSNRPSFIKSILKSGEFELYTKAYNQRTKYMKMQTIGDIINAFIYINQKSRLKKLDKFLDLIIFLLNENYILVDEIVKILRSKYSMTSFVNICNKLVAKGHCEIVRKFLYACHLKEILEILELMNNQALTVLVLLKQKAVREKFSVSDLMPMIFDYIEKGHKDKEQIDNVVTILKYQDFAEQFSNQQLKVIEEKLKKVQNYLNHSKVENALYFLKIYLQKNIGSQNLWTEKFADLKLESGFIEDEVAQQMDGMMISCNK
jgi:hypothetical protein